MLFFICNFDVRKLIKPMILLTTIQNRLSKFVPIKTLCYEFDIRYLARWIETYPQCFPKFVLNNNYSIIFNQTLFRYELHSTIYERK